MNAPVRPIATSTPVAGEDAAPAKAVGAAPRGMFVQSLQRGVAVLEIVANSATPRTCREIAELASLDRTITHRMLRTLELEGLVEASLGRYRLGARTLLFGNAYLDHLNLRRVALPHILNLLHHGLTDHGLSTISMFVPVGAFVTVVEQVWPADAPRDLMLRIGSRLPIDRTAAGRCVLAYMPEQAMQRVIGPVRAAELEERFRAIRAEGGVDFARDDEPHGVPGIGALSALIRDRAGRTVASLSVSGMGLEAQLSRSSDIAIQLRRTAEQIGMAIR